MLKHKKFLIKKEGEKWMKSKEAKSKGKVRGYV